MPGVASVQARAPARRAGGREFQALGPDAQKNRSPTVFNLMIKLCDIVKCLPKLANPTRFLDSSHLKIVLHQLKET